MNMGVMRIAEVLPPPPDSNRWADVLHWCVQVMDVGDPDLAFTASILSHALTYDGLTDRQAKYGQRIYDRLLELYDRQQLPRQMAASALVNLPTEGNA